MKISLKLKRVSKRFRIFIPIFSLLTLNACFQTQMSSESNSAIQNENVNVTKKDIRFKDINFSPSTDINFYKKVLIRLKQTRENDTKSYRIFSHAPNREKVLLISSSINKEKIAPFKLELPIGTDSLMVQKFDSNNLLISSKIYKTNNGEISVEI